MSDYNALQASILDVLGDKDLTTADAQKFIALAEPKLERDLLSTNYGTGAPFQMMARITDTTDTANAITLPADYQSARAVRLNDLRSRYASPELLDPSAQGFASVQVTLDYYQRLPVLSATNLTNWLLGVGYDLYMWAAALQYAAWGQEQDTVEVWSNYYNDSMRTIKETYKPQPRGGLYRHPNKRYGSFYTVIGTQMIFGNAKQ